MAAAPALMGTYPLHCQWVLPPTGANLLFHSTSILPTFLTLPLSESFGVVVGYNLMIILMILGNALMYYYFLAKTLDISRGSAFGCGFLFGFSPYFIFKAHSHINLIGGFFWGGCLAILLHCYLKDRFTPRPSGSFRRVPLGDLLDFLGRVLHADGCTGHGDPAV